MDHRAEVGQYNGTGLSNYGDPKYVEHVFRYYNGDGSFSGGSGSSSNNSSENSSGGFFSDLQNLMTNSVSKFFGIQLNDSSGSSDGGNGSSANVTNDQVDTSSLSGDVKKVVDFAASKIGCPYVWGGEGAPLTEEIVSRYKGSDHDITSNDGANGGYKAWIGKEGYDCSGLMQAAYKYIGKDIGRDTNAQLASPNGTEISVSEVQPGDLVFFGSRSNNHHVGMAIGNGKMIEAPSSGKTVRVSDIRKDAFAAKRFLNGGTGGPYSKLKTKVKAKYNDMIDKAIGGPADSFFSKTLNGNVTSDFGFRNTRGSIGRNHTGIDIGAKQGQDIKSPIGGQVVGKVPTQKSNGYGNLLQIKDDEGAVHYFGHMENPSALKPGDKVKPGDKLGNVGNTGNSTGSHLHYEVKQNGISVDPNKYLAKKGIGGEKEDNTTPVKLDTTQLLQSIIKILSTIAQNTVSISDIVTILKAMNPNSNTANNTNNNSEQSTAVKQDQYQSTQDQLTKILQKNNKDKNTENDQDLLNILNSLAKL